MYKNFQHVNLKGLISCSLNLFINPWLKLEICIQNDFLYTAVKFTSTSTRNG